MNALALLVMQEEWPQEEEILKRIQADFSPEHPEVGDRRQELVFTGKNLKVGADAFVTFCMCLWGGWGRWSRGPGGRWIPRECRHSGF